MIPKSKDDLLLENVFAAFWSIVVAIFLFFEAALPQTLEVIHINHSTQINADIQYHSRKPARVLISYNGNHYDAYCPEQFFNQPNTLCQETFKNQALHGKDIQFLIIRKAFSKKAHEGIILSGTFNDNDNIYQVKTSDEKIQFIIKKDYKMMIIIRLVILALTFWFIISVRRFAKLGYFAKI